MKQTEDYVFFFGEKDVFSNFYRVNFTHKGQVFFCSEQAVMWEKALLFGNTDIANKILAAKTAKECKALGRSREIAFDEAVWMKRRVGIYYLVLVSKFQVPSLRQAMLATGDRMLVEASPYDRIWGIGLGENDPRALDESQWRGKNLLGKTLYLVKERSIKGREMVDILADGKL